jgi:hypothetical protein
LYVAWIILCISSNVDIKQKPITHCVVYVNEAVPGSQNGLQAELSAQYKDAADLEEILYPLCSQEAVRLLHLSDAIEKNGKVMVIVKAFDFHLPAYDILCPSVLNGDWEVTTFIEAPESCVGWVCSSCAATCSWRDRFGSGMGVLHSTYNTLSLAQVHRWTGLLCLESASSCEALRWVHLARASRCTPCLYIHKCCDALSGFGDLITFSA